MTSEYTPELIAEHHDDVGLLAADGSVIKTDETDTLADGVGHLPAARTFGCEIRPSVDLEDSDDPRHVIYVRPGELRNTLDLAELLLAKTLRYFQSGGRIVTIRTDPGTGESCLQEFSTLMVMHALDGVSTWMGLDKRTNQWKAIDPIERYCRTLVELGDYKHLNVLKGLARQPYFRPDGSLNVLPGYDVSTALFGVFNADDFHVPCEPTEAQAKECLKVLGGLLDEFAFSRPQDRSAAMAAMLTAAIRPSLDKAPLFHVRAPQIASGKSYLCELIGVLATPEQGSPVGFPGGNEECEKLLLAQLARSPAVIEFDNLTTDLKAHKSLCTALTSERMEGRKLGRSKMFKVSTRTLFLSSGNNVGPVADMARRCVTIDLAPRCETPATRTFSRPDLVGEARAKRGLLVSAALTVIRAWIVAGRPKTECKSLASFPLWSDCCRQPLLWLGEPDPASSTFEEMASDPERELLGRALRSWHDCFGHAPMMARDVVARARCLDPSAEELHEVLMEVAGDRDRVNNRKLGQWLKRNMGRIVDGLKFSKAPKTRNADNWLVESVLS